MVLVRARGGNQQVEAVAAAHTLGGENVVLCRGKFAGKVVAAGQDQDQVNVLGGCFRRDEAAVDQQGQADPSGPDLADKGLERTPQARPAVASLEAGEASLDLLKRAIVDAFGKQANRDRALREDGLALLGLEQPFVRTLFDKMQSLPASERGVVAANGEPHDGCLTIWAVTIHGKSGQVKRAIVRLALTPAGTRAATLEALPLDQLHPPTGSIPPTDSHDLESILTTHAPQALHRDLEYRGQLAEGAWYSSRMLAVITLA